MPISVRKAFCFGMSISLFIGLAIAFSNNDNRFFNVNTATDSNQITYSSSNPVTDNVAKSLLGTDIWSQAAGITWNNGSGNMAFSANGYLQNTTVLHGIESIKVELVSGSVELLYGYKKPTDADTPMYYIKQINSTETYTFSDICPSYFRVVAKEASVINSIKVTYDCETSEEDDNAETLVDGLENSWIDASTVGKYARTSYVTGEGNVYKDSKRALRLDFSNVTNKFVLLNTQKNNIKEDEPLPDLSNAVLTLKAKFSDNIDNFGIMAKTCGSSWADSGNIDMDRSYRSEDGWYSYSLDFSKINYTANNSVIRIAIQPKGINSSNISNGYVLLDDIDYHYRTASSSVTSESIMDGLENLALDDGQTDCIISYDSETTLGRTSRSSLLAKPGRDGHSKDSTTKWRIAFNPEAMRCDSTFFDHYSNFSKGTLSFDYKPIYIKNPGTVYLRVFRTWSEHAAVTISNCSTLIRDGWYHFNYDLSQLNLSEGTCIRAYVGFDVDDADLAMSKVYIDNMKLDNDATTSEDYTLGWENMARDTGWEKCNVSSDFAVTASSTSLNSKKLTFTDKDNDSNKNFICLSPQGQGIHTQYQCNNGILEAKFKYSNNFVDKSIRLVMIDSNWKAARYTLPVSYIGDGWYLLKQDLSSLPTPWNIDTGFTPSNNLIRLGFGFEELTSSNKNDRTVWIDDVFLNTNADSSSATNASIWQAYDTENFLQTDSMVSGRTINNSSPLSFKNIKGGTDSTQLMMNANSAISSYSFRAPTVITDSGDSFGPENFEVLVEKYLYCPNNTSEKYGSDYGWRGAGWYPDALVPIDRIIKHNENNVEQGKLQGIWLNCTVPEDAAPGVYKGTGILTINGVDYNVPLEVKVYNATLSRVNHNKSMFLIWNDQTQIGEEMNISQAMADEYYRFLLKKNVNGDNNKYWEYTHAPLDKYQSFAEDFAKYIMPNPRISSYRIPSAVNYDDIYGYLNALVEKNIEEWNSGNHVDFFDKAMFALVDEPVQPSDENIPEAWEACKNAQTYLSQAKTALATKVASYTTIKNGLNSVRNIVTMNCDYKNVTGGVYKDYIVYKKYYPNLLNSTYVDTPCPTFDHIDDASQRATYQSFDHLWFYGCILPNLPYPSFHLDTPLLGQRTITWMQYQYGIEGQLYYCVNFYQCQDTNPWSDRDVWTNPLSAGKGAGDGQLLYPGYKYEIFGPISSMRMETIRAAYEDYEYFYMLDQNIAKYNANTSHSYARALDFISTETAKMYTGTVLKTRPTTSSSGYKAASFDAYRTFILEQLEYLN